MPVVPSPRSSRSRAARFLVLALALGVLAPAARAAATGPVHPHRLAGDPWGTCFAATLDDDGMEMGRRVPGTLQPVGPPFVSGPMDSLPPWLCRRPLEDFESRVPRLAGVVRAGMALDRALVEFEACFRAGRTAMLQAARIEAPGDRCFVVADLPPRLLALSDSVAAAEATLESASADARADAGPGPAERALLESVGMEVLVLRDLFLRTFASHLQPDRTVRHEFVEPRPRGEVVTMRLLPGDPFLIGVWQVRWNLDGWLGCLAVAREP